MLVLTFILFPYVSEILCGVCGCTRYSTTQQPYQKQPRGTYGMGWEGRGGANLHHAERSSMSTAFAEAEVHKTVSYIPNPISLEFPREVGSRESE